MKARPRSAAVVALALVLASSSAGQQPGAAPSPSPTPTPEPKPEEEGFPIDSQAVKEACGACHASDAKGRMTRISFRRTTPEGWQQTIRRMAALNGATLDPSRAREVLRYLANHLGLAPEEARPAAFEVERRLIEYKYAADKDTEQVCSKCHSMGRVLMERRTKEEWELLLSMHRGFYPLVDFQAFRRLEARRTTPGADGRPSDNRHPMEKALQHLAPAFLLRTPEWAAWSANMRAPRLDGRWAVVGSQPGKGRFFGEARITAKPGAPDEFGTEIRYAFARGGEAVTRQGQAIVYTGFQWRGRSTASSGDEALREVMFVERDWRRMSGRWFAGGYDEIGLDVTLHRVDGEAVVLGMTPAALRTGMSGQQVKVHGANLKASLAPADVDLGRGVRVTRVLGASAETATLEVEVDADAPVGPRDVFVAGASRADAAVVFASVDSLKVTPRAGLARVGGIRFPKQLQQFEAIALSNGADGQAGTKDDLELGAVVVNWSVEEFHALYQDDDKSFVGTLDASGLFTPAEEGPNPKRSGNRNNVGDVWVVATLPADSPWKPKKPLRARAHLVVTVPLYMRWDASAVAP
jgi:quinohemoprotein amine dehydrogenase